MKYGCCLGIEHYELIRRSQADAICLAAKDVAAADQKTFNALVDILKKGLLEANALNSFCPPTIKLTGADFDLAKLRVYAALLLDRAAQIGVKYIGIGAPQSRNIPAGYSVDLAHEQFDRAIYMIAQQAKAYDIEILLEAVCSLECNFITTTTEALEVVRRLGLANTHLVYDIYHAFMMNETAEPILEAKDSIKLVHIAKDISGKRGYLDVQAGRDFEDLLQGLRDIRFDGEIDIEAFYGDPFSELASSLDLLKNRFDRKV
jgi:sugar phosphate isomerase/epimerase